MSFRERSRGALPAMASRVKARALISAWLPDREQRASEVAISSLDCSVGLDCLATAESQLTRARASRGVAFGPGAPESSPSTVFCVSSIASIFAAEGFIVRSRRR